MSARSPDFALLFLQGKCFMYYLRLHEVMALRPILEVLEAGGWSGGESYNGRRGLPDRRCFFWTLFFSFEAPANITPKIFCEG